MSDHRKFRTIAVLAFALALVSIALPFAGAQQTGGTIRGQVKDSAGASIPAADVTISNGAAFSKTISTDEQGAFSFAGLPPAKYSVRVSHAGFTPFEVKNIGAAPGKVQSLDIPMTLQASKQEVTVEAEAVGAVTVDVAQNVGAL